jgi:hypothetical protein
MLHLQGVDKSRAFDLSKHLSIYPGRDIQKNMQKVTYELQRKV